MGNFHLILPTALDLVGLPIFSNWTDIKAPRKLLGNRQIFVEDFHEILCPKLFAGLQKILDI